MRTTKQDLQHKGAAVKGVSTKEAILTGACEIINSVGMADFRIDTLAKELDISPGNVTYHFPKKEDIATAIWQQCNHEVMQGARHYISPLMDLKQLFLLLRHVVYTCYLYRGVACYKSGDIGVITRGLDEFKNYNLAALHKYEEAFSHLRTNGYIVEPTTNKQREMLSRLFFTTLIWSINMQISQSGGSPATGFEDETAIHILYPLSPYFTPQGKEQYRAIVEACALNVNNN